VEHAIPKREILAIYWNCRTPENQPKGMILDPEKTLPNFFRAAPFGLKVINLSLESVGTRKKSGEKCFLAVLWIHRIIVCTSILMDL
jgi:hypothetical protein